MRYILFTLCGLFTACADCYSYRNYFSDIKNPGTVDAEIQVCKVDAKTDIKTVTITSGGLSHVQWGSSKIYNRTDLSNLCHDRHDVNDTVQILLSEDSRKNVRLCLNRDNSYSVIPVSQICAVGTSEVIDTCKTQ